MLVPMPQCFQSASVFSLQKSSLLLLSGHKPQHCIPIQANTSNPSHKPAGIECSSPWLRHESPLSGTLPSWKHTLGSAHSSKGLARMLAVLWYANHRGSCSTSTRSTANAVLGKRRNSWPQRPPEIPDSQDSKGMVVVSPLGHLEKQSKDKRIILVEKGNAPYPCPPTPTELFSGLVASRM